MRGQPDKSSANFYLCAVFGPLWVKLSVLLLLMREKQRLLPSQTLKRETAWKPRRKWLYDMHPHCNRDHTFTSEINFTFLQNIDCVNRAIGSWQMCLSTKLHFTSLVLQMIKKGKSLEHVTDGLRPIKFRKRWPGLGLKKQGQSLGLFLMSL